MFKASLEWTQFRRKRWDYSPTNLLWTRRKRKEENYNQTRTRNTLKVWQKLSLRIKRC